MEAIIKYEGREFPVTVHDTFETDKGVMPDYISEYLRLNKQFFEVEVLDYIKHTYSPNTVLDIGANIGNHSKFFSEVMNANVTSFEPQPNNYELLKKNCPSITSHNVGLSSESGTASASAGFMEHDGKLSHINLGATKLTPGEGEFPLQTLDHYELAPDFIKIDVEGMEEQVVRGGLTTIERFRPVLVVETLTMDAQAKLLELLTPLKYSITKVFGTPHLISIFEVK